MNSSRGYKEQEDGRKGNKGGFRAARQKAPHACRYGIKIWNRSNFIGVILLEILYCQLGVTFTLNHQRVATIQSRHVKKVFQNLHLRTVMGDRYIVRKTKNIPKHVDYITELSLRCSSHCCSDRHQRDFSKCSYRTPVKVPRLDL